MTKNEKGYFKKSIIDKNKSNYILLFNIIDKQKKYDEKAIKSKLSLTALRGQQLAFTKHYLYETILKSLKSFHPQPSVDSQLKEMIKNAEILYHLKKRKEDAVEILQKALLLSEKYERLLVKLEIHNFLYVINNPSGKVVAGSFENHTHSYHDQKEILNQLQCIISLRKLETEYRTILENENFSYREQKKLVNKILQDETLSGKKIPSSFLGQYYYYKILSEANAAIFFNHVECYHYSCKLIRCMESDKNKLGEDITNYLTAHYYLLNSLINLNKPQELKSQLKKIITVFCINGPDYVRLDARAIVSCAQLINYLKSGDKKEASEYLKKNQLVLPNNWHVRNPAYAIELYFAIAITHFLNKNYHHTKINLNRIFSDSSTCCSEIKAYSRIIYLITIYDTEDYEYLSHLCSVYKRKPVKRPDCTKLETAVLTFMSRVGNFSNDKKKLLELTKLKSTLLNLPLNSYTQKIYSIYNLTDWVNEKIKSL